MSDPNRPDNRPRTFGYDNTHILIAAIVILGVLGGLWYVYGAYVAPKLSVIECFETDGGVNYRSDRLI
jgi:hypothetical protein